MALSAAVQEAIWLKKLLADLGVVPKQPVVIMEDNQGALAVAKNPIAHTRTKHIDIRYHFTREAVRDQKFNLCYCPTKKMLADLLTKPLPKEQLFEVLRQAMGMEQTWQLSGSDVSICYTMASTSLQGIHKEYH